MKKILICLIIFICISNLYYFAYADDIEDEEDIVNVSSEIENVNKSIEKNLNINSKAATIIDRETNRVLYGKNENKKVPMASTTKIMTIIIVVEKGNLNDKVIISKKAASVGGSRLGLKEGDEILVKDLLYGLMLKSGNDAAIACAEYISKDVNNFVNLMNEKAKDLNLLNTHFVTPHGLDNDEHYTTAYELAIIANYAMKNEIISQIVGTKCYTLYINNIPKSINNTNELLGNLNGVYGVKTGFTNNAGRCLVTAIRRNNLDTICVVLGANTKKNRTKDSIELIEYVYGNFKKVNIKKNIKKEFQKWYNNNKSKLIVLKGKEKNIELYIDDNIEEIPISDEEENSIKYEFIYYPKIIIAPVYKNIEIGKINIKVDGKTISSENMYVKNTILEKNIIDYLKEYINVLYDGVIFNK